MRSSLTPLLTLVLLGVATSAAADDFDFGIEDDDLSWEVSSESGEGEPSEDLFGLDDDPVEDFDVLDDFDAFEDPEDEPLVGLTDQLLSEQMEQAKPVEAGGKTATLAFDVVGKEPLADNYPAQIVAVERDAVVVELPVLLGRSRAGFEGQPYWLQAEVRAGETVVATTTQWVGRESLAEFGPSFAFFQVMVPVTATAGELTFAVSRLDQPGAAGAPLFTRTVPYSLK